MDLGPLTLALLVAAATAAATYGLCRFWHARQLRDLNARLDKADRARQAAQQQSQQARKQVEMLQKELAAQHKARAEATSARRRSEHLVQTLREAERPASPIVGDEAPALPAHGFADTMPFQDSRAA